jgi:DNA-directed RNA polymerase subunit H (RpoH/RPB5)
MSASNNRILSIYKSRTTILEILSDNLGYETKEYDGFSINEIDAMYSNAQLDMLLKHTSNERKVYVKYYLTAKQIRPQNLDDILEDLFIIENVLTKEDTLIIITEDEPNDTIINKVKYLFDHSGIFIVIRYIKRLQFNILKHQLVPKATILQDDEAEALKTKFHMKTLQQLPEISRFDPHALSLSLRPGQVILIERKSNTAMTYEYYRICV